MVRYPFSAAKAVATADQAVDSGDTSPYPWDDQSYHFNRNLSGGEDSRIQLYKIHYKKAKLYCTRPIDLPDKAAKELGTSLHPLQDWVAHGDYGMKNKGEIWTIHNSRSPQFEFGDSGGYPDDTSLDAVGSPDGRPTKSVIIDKETRWVTTSLFPVPIVYIDFAYYEKGNKRYTKTRRMTVEELKEFIWYVRTYGGCRCQKYFGIIP